MNWPRPCAAVRRRVERRGRRALCLADYANGSAGDCRDFARGRGRAAFEFITGPPLEQPYRVGKRLLPPLEDRFSARRGTYRVIYQVDDVARVVTVVDIGHRRDIYQT